MYVMYACMWVQSFDAIVINGVAVVMPSCWGVVLGAAEGDQVAPHTTCHTPQGEDVISPRIDL